MLTPNWISPWQLLPFLQETNRNFGWTTHLSLKNNKLGEYSSRNGHCKVSMGNKLALLTTQRNDFVKCQINVKNRDCYSFEVSLKLFNESSQWQWTYHSKLKCFGYLLAFCKWCKLQYSIESSSGGISRTVDSWSSWCIEVV